MVKAAGLGTQAKIARTAVSASKHHHAKHRTLKRLSDKQDWWPTKVASAGHANDIRTRNRCPNYAKYLGNTVREGKNGPELCTEAAVRSTTLYM